MAKNFARLYPDLVDPSDLVGQQLVAELHTFFNHTVPSSLRAAPQRTPRRTFSFSLPRWPRVAVVSLLSIFALVGATYVALPLLQQLWASDRGLVHVTNGGLVRDVDASQTIDGVTVHLQRAYADANRIVVGYTLEFPKSNDVSISVGDGTPFVGEVTLTDADGRQYPGLASTFARASPLGPQLLGAHLLSFEGPGAVRVFRDTTFTLSISKLFAISGAGGPATASFSGPWVFTFTLASAPGRVVSPSLAVTSGDLSLAFTRIVVAPSATRFDYRLTRSGSAVTGSIALVVNGRGLSGAGHCERDGQCFFLTTEPLFDSDALRLDAVLIIPDGSSSEATPAQRRITNPPLLPLR